MTSPCLLFPLHILGYKINIIVDCRLLGSSYEKTYLQSFPYRTDLKIYFSGFLTSYCRFSFEANGCRVVFSVNVAGLLFANAVGIFVTSILGKSDKWKFYFSMIRTIKRLLSTFYQLKINDSVHFMLKLQEYQISDDWIFLLLVT